MYSFNIHLWQRLPSILGISRREFGKMADNTALFHSKYLSEMLLSVKDFINLCNRIRIPLSHFILVDGNIPPILTREYYVMPEDTFSPVSFKFENWLQVYGSNIEGKKMSSTALSKCTGISYQSICLYKQWDTFTMRMTALLNVCNTLCIPLSNFIDDPNEILPSCSTDRTEEYVRVLQMEQAEDKKQIKALTQENQKLRKRMSEVEKNLSTHGGMIAAEPEAEYGRKASTESIRPWRFNKSLLLDLHNRKGLPLKVFYSAVGRTNFSNKNFSEGNILVDELIKVLNHYGVSSRHFFYREGEREDISRDVLFREGEHVEIRFDKEKLREAFGPLSISGILLKDAMEEIGASYIRNRSIFRENSTLRVDELATFCNLIGVSPWAFIEDLNSGPAHHVTYAEALLEENRRLRGEIVEMKRKLKGKQG